MLRFLLFFFLLLFTLPAVAQEPLVPDERVTFGNRHHTSRDALFFSEKDSRGNLIVAGYTERDFTFTDVQIMSFNENLELQWSDRLTWDGISYDYPLELLVDREDHIWIVSKNLYSNSQANFIIARYSPSGEKLWEYRSPETVDTSFLNMRQYRYFFDEQGYLNFNYVKGVDYPGVPHFFKISPRGETIDEYHLEIEDGFTLSQVSHYKDYFHAISFGDYTDQNLYYKKYNKDLREEHLLEISTHQWNRVQNSIFEKGSGSVTDKDGNYVLVLQGNFHDDHEKLHKGSAMLSVNPSGELNFFLDDDGSIDKYLLGFRILENNRIAVLSNTQSIEETDAEPLLTLEIFSEEGERIFFRKSESVVGNIAKLEKDQIMLRDLFGNISVYDYELNLLAEYDVPPTEKIFVPQDLHMLGASPVLVGTLTAQKYEGSDYFSEEDYLIRKIGKNGVEASFTYNGEGTSKHYTYQMIRDEKGDYLVSTEEFYGPHNISLYGSRAPHETKVLRYNNDLEFLEEKVVAHDYQLWQEPELLNEIDGDQYRYELKKDKDVVNFYLNDNLQWTQQLSLEHSAYEEAHNALVDKNGNLILTSSLYHSNRGKIHRFTPAGDYTFIETGGHIRKFIILSNNWIFSYFEDDSIKVYSPQLKLISSRNHAALVDGEYYPDLIEKNNKVLFGIRHRQKVLVFDQFANHESEFTLEGLIHPSVAFFDENDVFNVYHIIGSGIYLAHGHNWSRGAISRYAKIVKDYIGEVSTGDMDKDGVPDDIDQCPNTAEFAAIDEFGCELLQLDQDHFTLKMRNETCPGKNNGILEITAKEEMNYLAEMNGEISPFNTNIKYENLSPGTYRVCLKVEGMDHTSRCFEFEISAGQDLLAQMNLDTSGPAAKMNVNVEIGTAPFILSINGKPAGEFDTNNFSIPVNDGDLLEINSAIACEGKVTMEVDWLDGIRIYPNPVYSEAVILLPQTPTENLLVEILDVQGRQLHSFIHTSGKRNIEIEASALQPGTYFARLHLEKLQILKFIKK